MLHAGQQLRQHADIVVEPIDDSLCLFNPLSSEVVVLNPTAANIWALADGDTSVAEIVRILARAYQTDELAVSPDVESTLDDLLVRGFVVDQFVDA